MPKTDSYSSFKISISGISFKNSLDVENWPEGMFVKRYYFVPSNTGFSGNSTDVDAFAETSSQEHSP